MSTTVTQFISAYCWSFAKNIPSAIINICVTYCNVGEKFNKNESGCLIEGANETICRFPKPYNIRTCFGSNTLCEDLYIYYHWRLIVRKPSDVCWSINDEGEFNYDIGIALKNDQNLRWKFEEQLYEYDDDGVTLDLYVNLKDDWISLSQYDEIDNHIEMTDIPKKKEYRLAIRSCCLSFEILEFHAANEGGSDLNLALTMPLTRNRYLFESAINKNPKSFTYCDKYISCLQNYDAYIKAYEFVLRFVEKRWIPRKQIVDIAVWLWKDHRYEQSKIMFELVDDESLKKTGFMHTKASNYHSLKDYENALKYFEFCMANTESNNIISYCLGSMALLYDFKNTQNTEKENLENSIRLTKKALEYHPDEPNEHSNLGYFYLVKGDYAQSYVHLKRSIEIEPNGSLVKGNMANLLYAMKKYDESIPYFEKSLDTVQDMKHPEVGPKCLENYANVLHLRQKYKKSNDLLDQLIGRNDFAEHPNKDVVYWMMSLNFEKMKNIKKAMQYVKKAQKIAAKDLYTRKMKKLRYKN